MYILGGTSASKIAQDLSLELKQPILNVVMKRFPDEEFYIRVLDDVKGQNVIVVQTTYPDTKIVELLLIQDALREAGAEKIIIVIPYFGYSRQDKQFQKGEPISARVLAQHVSLRADSILTIDPHKQHLLDFFNVPAYGCSAVSEIAKYIQEKNVDFILAPDKGARQSSQYAAEIIGCDYDYMEKTRIDGTTITIKPKKIDVKNKHVVILDDIISTGGTMAKSIMELKKQGAKKVSVACTHGLFIGDAINKLLSSGCDEIISTDTIQNDFSKVKTAPCIAKNILKLKLLQ
ncbi:MAG: ribose-phosphate diphosphokinase [Thermoplasmatota archaeon]